MTKPHSYQKKLITVVLAVIIVVSGVVIFRFENPSVGFKYFVPTHLPPNVSIKERRISISPGGTTVEQNFRTVDWVYSIQEYKASSAIGSVKQNYDPASVGPTCSFLTTTDGQRYRLCHWIDYGQIDVHQIVFVKEGTEIRSDIPTKLHQQMTIEEISKYVDSFKQKSTVGLPVLRSSGA